MNVRSEHGEGACLQREVWQGPGKDVMQAVALVTCLLKKVEWLRGLGVACSTM